jgi:hypothetical protein
MKQRQRVPTTSEEVIRVVRSDCERQAEQVHQRLGEVVAALHEGNHLGALGALVGVEQQIVDLSAILKLSARTPSGIRLEAPNVRLPRSPKRGDKRQ